MRVMPPSPPGKRAAGTIDAGGTAVRARRKGIMKIYFENGPRGGEELEFALPEITVGSEDENVLCIPEVGVSRYHAVILRSESGGWLVRDLASTNGVKVNRVRIEGEKELAEGDTVEFGVQAVRVGNLGESAPQLVFGPVETEAEADAKSRKTSKLPEEPVHHPKITEETMVISGNEEELTALLNSGEGALFDAKRKKSEEAAGDGKSGGKPGKKRNGLFFYTLVGCVAVIAISAAMLAMSPRESKTAKMGADSSVGTPFSLYFERDITARDNVFRFALLLEDGKLEFSVDDLKSQRHVSRTEKVSDETVELLRSRIANSGFWTEPPPLPSPGAEASQVRKVMVADGTRAKELTYVGSYAPSCFGIVESLVDDLAETYGVQTISLTPDELQRLAESNYTRAEDLYGNREAKDSNLRDAIRRYRVTVGALEQFMPRPALWEKARKRLDEAEALRARKLDNLEMERVRLGQISDFDAMRAVFLRIMALADEDSREYYAARERLFKLDSMMRGRKR